MPRPTGFIPDQDLGYLINIIQLPPGASLSRTDDVARKVTKIVLDTPGVAHAVPIVGLDGATFTTAPNAAVVFTPLDPFKERATKGLERASNLRRAQQELRQRSRTRSSSACRRRRCAVSAPPAASRWRCRTPKGAPLSQLEEVAQSLVGAANQDPGLARVFTTFNTRTPKVYADIDRVRAEMLGVNADDIFQTLEVYLGSQYVNDFNFLGRTYRVTAQADGKYPAGPTRHLAVQRRVTRRARWCRSARSPRSATSPAPTASSTSICIRPPRSKAATKPGYSTGYGLAGHGEACCGQLLPEGYSAQWTELAYQEKQAGNTAIFVFARGGRVRVSAARRAVRKLGAAARRHSDRADVSARGSERTSAARHGREHSESDRLRGA